VCTKEEQRAVIRFLWSEGVPGAEIHRRLSTQYGDSALPRRSVYESISQELNLHVTGVSSKRPTTII